MSKIRGLLQDSRGFSFVEVIVSSVLLSICLIYIYGALNDQVIEFKYGKDRNLANSLAQQLAEELQVNFDEATADSTLVTNFANKIQNKYHFDLDFNVTDINDNLRKASIEISKQSKQLALVEIILYNDEQ